MVLFDLEFLLVINLNTKCFCQMFAISAKHIKMNADSTDMSNCARLDSD